MSRVKFGVTRSIFFSRHYDLNKAPVHLTLQLPTSPMDNPTPSSSSGGGGAAAAANASSDEHRKTSPATAADFFDEEHTFDDILLPVDLFDFTHGLDAGDGCYVDGQAAIGQKPLSPAPEPAAEQQPSPAPEHGDDERLVMYYQGQEYVFDSVQPQKVSLGLAAQCACFLVTFYVFFFHSLPWKKSCFFIL